MSDLDPVLENKMAAYISRAKTSNPEFYERLKKQKPHWFVNDIGDRVKEKKRQLIEMAYNNDPRPNLRKHPLGASLKNYTSKWCNSYDAEFDSKIRKIRPDWFDVVDLKKKELIRMAKKNAPKPSWKTSLGRVLAHYISPKSASYDPVFTEKIKKLAPMWFDAAMIIKNTQKHNIIELANKRCRRPDRKSYLGRALAKFTQKSHGGSSFDPEFNHIIRELRPDWFRPS